MNEGVFECGPTIWECPHTLSFIHCKGEGYHGPKHLQIMRCRSGRVLKPRPKEWEESYVYATTLYQFCQFRALSRLNSLFMGLAPSSIPHTYIQVYLPLQISQSYNLRTIYVFSFFFSLHVTLKRSAGKGKTRCPNV